MTLPLVPIRIVKPEVVGDQVRHTKVPRCDGIRVLIVDDEADGRELVARFLDAAGATVQTAGSAAEALAVLDRKRSTSSSAISRCRARTVWPWSRAVRAGAPDACGRPDRSRGRPDACPRPHGRLQHLHREAGRAGRAQAVVVQLAEQAAIPAGLNRAWKHEGRARHPAFARRSPDPASCRDPASADLERRLHRRDPELLEGLRRRIRPVWGRFSFFWKSRTACSVLGPMTPSTGPGFMPLPWRACWTLLTWSWEP